MTDKVWSVDIFNFRLLGVVPNQIYRLYNTDSGASYIGSAKNAFNRLRGHLRCLNLDIHKNKELQEDFNKNPDKYTAQTLEVFNGEDERVEKETK